MIFPESSIQGIIDGNITQTRRLVKAGEQWLFFVELRRTRYMSRPVIITQRGRLKWQAGGDYAVQPGNGKPCLLWNSVTGEWATREALQACDIFDQQLIQRPGGWQELRIRILDIRCEDVRHISKEDVMAGGFTSYQEFWTVWCNKYDEPALAGVDQLRAGAMQLLLEARPDERYRAWTLTLAPCDMKG